MAKYSNVVEYSIITDVDTSGVTKLQNELTKLKQSLKNEPKSFNRLGLNPEDIDKSIQKINQLQTALTKAFNAKIGTLDLGKLNASLQQEHSSLQMIARDWEQMGSRGKVAISSLSNALLSMNSNAVTINTTLSKMANTFGNTVRWGITAGIFQEMVSSVQGAVSYMKDLDESLTQIQMVTNSSKENMRELAQYANQAAQALGSTTVDYTNAVKVFVQEGFSEAESKQYANLSTKLANVSEQDTATTSDQITAYRNAFQLDYQQTVEAMDKVANVANNTASNVNELMTASQRSASVAQAVGASQDSFLASLATIQSVTRQTAEEIGNGMKTIYQRMADIKLSGETEDGVDYGKYANTLKQVGVDVLDAAGEFKGMDEIFKELMAVWKDMSQTQQIAVGETVAGKFQYNRFAALMNNADYYEKSLNATQDASGMMDQMNDYYMESIEGKLKTLQAAGEQVMSTLFDQDAVEPVLDNVIALVNGLNDMVDAAGGLNGVLTVLSGIMLRTFSTQIAGTINNIASSFGLMMANTNNAKNFSNVATSLGLIGNSSDGSLGKKLVSGVADNYDSLSIKSKEKLEQISKQIVVLDETRLQLTQKQRAALQPIISTATKEMQLRQESGAALKQEINDLQKKYSAGKISTATYNEQLKLLQSEKKTLEQQTSQYAQAEQAAARLTQALENGETNISDQVKRVKELARELKIAGFDAAELDRLIEQAEIAANNESNLGSAVDDALETTSLESKINNVTKLIGSVTSLAFGFSMVSEAIRVCADDSATLEEKISAVVMNGLMGITMAVPGIMDAAKAIKGLRAAHIAAASGAAIETAAETAGNAARTTRNVLDAQWLLMKAPYIAAAAAIALAIAGIVLVIKNMTDEAAQANREFERQKDILADVKKAYSDAKESLESLHNSVESISDLQSSLEDMTKGTDEWTEATRQLNDEILNLLQTYPELAKYVDNSNGVLTIKQEDLDSFYDQQLERSQHLGDMASLQQISTLDAENTKRIAEFSEKFDISTERIQEALDKGEHTLVDAAETHAGQINTAYAELSSKIETNSRSMEVLGSSIDNLDGSLKDYTLNDKSPEELTEEWVAQKNTAKQNITEQFGKEQFAAGPGGQQSLGWSVDFSAISDNRDLLDMISQATGQEIIKGVDVSWFDNTLKVITATGEELEHSTEEWMEILANSEAVIAAHSEKVKENAGLFELFGAEMNEDKTGFIKKETNGSETKITKINSLEDLGVDPSIIQNIEAYQSGEYNEVLKSVDPNAVFEGSVEAFAQALIDGKQPLIDFTATLEENLNKLNDSHSLSDLDYDYDQAKIDNQSPELDENYQQQLQDLTDAAAEAFDLDAEKITAQAKELREEYELTEGAARDLAIQNQRMNRGINDLADNWEKWEQILANSDDTASDYADTVVELTHVIEDLTGTDNLELSSTFFESAENLDLLRQAAEGDLDAINNLGIAVGQDLVRAMDAFTTAEREAIANLDSLSDKDRILANKIESFDQAKSIVSQGLSDLQAQLDNLGVGQDVYTLLGGEDWVNALNDMAVATQMSVEQMNNLLNSIGVQANVTVQHQKTETEVPEYTTIETVEEVDSGRTDGEHSRPAAYKKTSHTYISGYKKVQGYIDVAQINTGDAAGTPPTVTYVGNGPVSYSSTPSGRSSLGGGGGGSKSSSPKTSTPKETTPKEVKPKEYATSEWDYLTDITNDLERASAAMEKLTKLEDRLFGASRISNLQKLKQEYAGYISLLQQEVSLAKSHAKRLRTKAYDENGNLTMNAYAGRAGISHLQFDNKGNLENGRQIELALLNRLNDATAAYNANRYNEDTSGWYSDRVDDAKQDYDGFMNAMKEYQDTLSKIEEGESQIQEYQEKIQDAADEIIDSIQEGIEGIIEAVDSQRDFDRMYRNWNEGGNGYSHFGNDQKYFEEGLQSLFDKTIDGKSILDVQTENLKNRIGDVKNVFDGDSSNADKEKLSEQAAQENLREAIDSLTDSLEQAVDYYDSLIETIEQASDKMDELIDSRLGEYDRISDYLDTRLDQYKILNSQDYQGQADLYSKQIETNLQKLVDINTSIEAKQATVKSLEKLEASGKSLSTEEQAVLQDARDKINDLQKDQLGTETKILTAIKSRLQAKVTKEAKQAINNLFGGQDVEWISQQWELASKTSALYLDDYNRAFEIQKLQLRYQDLLNNTQETELATRQKITVEMNDQLKYLREKKGLSEGDVKYANLQLEILQRTIALEEARNNKNQMQLQRNAAGNYDFVYTADEDAVTTAMEALLAKQQESYNLSKQMYLDLYQNSVDLALDIYNQVVQIATDATLETQEAEERITFLFEQLGTYVKAAGTEMTMVEANLYNDFVGAAGLITEENAGNLQKVFDTLASFTDSMRQSTDANLDSIEASWTDATNNMSQAAEEHFLKIGGDATQMSDTIINGWGAVRTATGEMLQKLTADEKLNYGTMKEDVAKNVNEMMEHIGTSSTTQKESLEALIGGIDDRFGVSKDNIIGQSKDIDSNMKTAIENISGYMDEYKTDTQESLGAANDSYSTFVTDSLDNATTHLSILVGTERIFGNDLNKLNGIISSCGSSINTWKASISNAMNTANSFIAHGNSLMRSLYNISVQAGYATSDFYELASAIQYAAEWMGALNGMSYSVSSPGYSSGGGGGRNGFSQEALDAAYRIWTYGDPGGGGYWYEQGVAMYGQALADEILSLFNSGYGYAWMDTGGYTGTWNHTESLKDSANGKLAVLHQKELVLNPEDTENMLSAVGLVRDIVSNLNNTTKISSNFNQQSVTGNNVEQRVSINATFPGVTDVVEIKHALEQLADDAYQVANQYKY